MSDTEEQANAEREKNWIREYNVNPEDLAELREAFAMFDASEQEVIPADQLGNMLRTMGQSPTNKEIEDMVADCNVDSENGTVSLDEVIRVVCTRGIKPNTEMQEELEEALKVFDRDGRGCIDVKELQRALQSMGEPVEDDDIKEMCKLAGVDGDGMMNYYDLVTHMCSK